MIIELTWGHRDLSFPEHWQQHPEHPLPHSVTEAPPIYKGPEVRQPLKLIYRYGQHSRSQAMNWNQIKRKSGGERERKKGYQSIREQTNKQKRNDNLYILFIEDSNYSIAKKKLDWKQTILKINWKIQFKCIHVFRFFHQPLLFSSFHFLNRNKNCERKTWKYLKTILPNYAQVFQLENFNNDFRFSRYVCQLI